MPQNKAAKNLSRAPKAKHKAAKNKWSGAGWPFRILVCQWHKSFFRRIALVSLAVMMLVLSSSYGISYWYLAKHRREPLQLGVTFIPGYARYLGVDPKQTMQAAIDELGIKRFRLTSYWDEIERNPGQYDFTELDWQFQKAEKAGVQVDLSLGLRQPRWPECHMPGWAMQQPKSLWYPKLNQFIQAVVERYKNSSSLVSYQVENEFFMTIFGECHDFERSRLIDEYNLVKRLDSSKPIIVTRSNNWGGVPINEPTPDLYGVAVYKRVWDQNLTHRYFEYPYPPWFYGFLGGAGEMLHGKPLIIHELQMEPWLPDGFDLLTSSLAEQDKSMNADIMHKRFRYAEDTGLRTIDTWGMEWWYRRKIVNHDPSLWVAAQQEFAKAKQL